MIEEGNMTVRDLLSLSILKYLNLYNSLQIIVESTRMTIFIC